MLPTPGRGLTYPSFASRMPASRVTISLTPRADASVSLAGCLEFVRNDVEIHHLVSEGMSLAEATCSVLNIPLTDELRAVFEAAERR